MFEAKIKNGLMLKNMMFAIKDVFKIIKWFCGSEGISIYGMDVNQCCFLRLQLNRDAFDHYRCDRDINFATTTPSFSKILKYVTNEDMITITFRDRRDSIHVLVETKGEVEWTQFVIKLIDYNFTEVDINPDHLEKSATISMPSSKFQRICGDLAQIGDRITIACSENKGRFFAKGEIGTGCVHLYSTFFVEEEHREIKFHIKEPLSQTFNLKILNQLTKATPLTPIVTLNLRTVGPIEIIYNINTEKLSPNCEPYISTLAVLRFYLSPNVEIED